MADMQGPGRVHRDILDVHDLALAHGAAPIRLAHLQDHAQGRGPETLLKGEIDEAGSGDLGFLDIGIGDDQRDQPLGKLARRHTSLLGKHHGRVGGKVAVARILRRLQGDAFEARLGRHDAVMLQLLDDSQDTLVESGENVHAR